MKKIILISLLLGYSFISIARELPNVIIIYSDDQGYGDVSSNEHNAPIHTPNIDRISREGILFTQGYVCAPTCAPSRAGLMTGKYPQRMGIYKVNNPFEALPVNEKIAPEFFKEKGYATALIGKWHLGGEFFPEKRPENRGFDRFYGWLDSTHDYWKANTGRSHTYGSSGYAPLYDQEQPVEEMPEYLTRTLTDKALEFIDDHKETPFFLYFAHHCSHVPLQVPRESYEKFAPLKLGENTMTTRAMYYELDNSVGEILNRLEFYGIRENTIIVFQSDNGGGEPEAQLNWIYRGGKFTLLEGGIRVPTIISWPKVLPQNAIYRNPVINIDILPTLLSASGIAPKEEAEGVDLMPYLLGKNTGVPHKTLYWDVNNEGIAIREGDWKLVFTSNGQGLYNLKDDPQELNDLRDKYPEIGANLLAKHKKWSEKNKIVQPSKEELKIVENAKKNANPEYKGWSYSDKFGESR